ncbi:MAG: hypothetical protein GY771_09230 [bacterium]|nr:hypothetical protein [bacterium]
MDFEDYLKIRFIYEIAPLIHEYILAGEEGINAPKIKEAYEKGDIKENLEAIFDRWVIGEDVEEEVDKSEITDENQDDTDDGVE